MLITELKNKDVTLGSLVKYHFPNMGEEALTHPPVIIGAGPAGLFCAYMLAKAGFRPILLERGEAVEERQKKVDHFWATGELDPQSNVQFGEGGAGTFSDGKLNTLVKDNHGRSRFVLKTFVEFGAKDDILYESKPHIGTDVLIDVVRNMRNEIIKLDGEIRFNSQVTDFKIENNEIIACSKDTGIFIYPGYQFKVIDGLITNFHLPESTLIMLVSAFLGYDKTMEMYELAVKEKYRFFSFGDATLLI